MTFYLSICMIWLFMLELSADRLVQIMKISLCAIMCEEVRLLPNVLHDWTEIHNLAAWQAEEVLMVSQETRMPDREKCHKTCFCSYHSYFSILHRLPMSGWAPPFISGMISPHRQTTVTCSLWLKRWLCFFIAPRRQNSLPEEIRLGEISDPFSITHNNTCV